MKFLTTIAIVILFYAGLSICMIQALRKSLDLPVMYVSYPASECVRVVPPEAGTCELPPDKYVAKWVKQ